MTNRDDPNKLERFIDHGYELVRLYEGESLRPGVCGQGREAIYGGNIVRGHLAPLLVALKIPVDAFRHAYSTLLISGGASVRVAHEQLRHGDLHSHCAVWSRDRWRAAGSSGALSGRNL